MSAALLDTHAFLWFVFDDPRLSPTAATLIEDPTVEKLLSTASVWEIVIKAQIGKLGLGIPIDRFVRDMIAGRQLTVVPIELDHLVWYGALPLHHRDPFDRLLVAQASALDVPIVSSDANLARYDVRVTW